MSTHTQTKAKPMQPPRRRKGPMRTPDPLPGTRFGRWTVTGPAPDRRYECPKQPVVHRMLRCRCDCGVERDVALFRLQQGATKSCGSCGFARPSRRLTLVPGEMAVRDAGGKPGRTTVWRYVQEVAPLKRPHRDLRMLVCRCSRGHEMTMTMAAFRGDPGRLPLCRTCLKAS